MNERSAIHKEIPTEKGTFVNHHLLEGLEVLLANLKELEEKGLIKPEISERRQDEITSTFYNNVIQNITAYPNSTYKLKNIFKYDVFICHSSKDKIIISIIIHEFLKNGITYWVDSEQITFGDRILEKIEDGIKNSKYIMPCLSNNFIESKWGRAEYSSILNAELSGESDRIIIPLQLDECEEDHIPLLLRDKRRVIYSNKDEFVQFLAFLKKCRP